MVGKALYFVKVDPSKKINKTAGNDDSILFGEISEKTITSLNLLMTGIFKPLVSQLGNESWGSCEEEQKKDFLQSFDKFNKELSDAITSINEKKKLDRVPENYFTMAKSYMGTRDKNQEPEYNNMIAAFRQILGKWNDTIEARLKDNDVNRNMTNVDVGPRSEIEYWRLRM